MKSKNEFGDPIKLPSKILAVTQGSESSNAVYIAESAATVKCVDIGSSRVKATFRGPTSPLTSLCFGGGCKTLYAGCWDKTIWSWDIKTCTPGTKFKGHLDFVKTILFIALPDGTGIIISGGAEGDIIFWDPSTGSRIHLLKAQYRAIEHLLTDPYSEPKTPTIFIATSNKEILKITLPSTIADLKSTRISDANIAVHETSVYRLYFDSDGDLWTASADKTAKRLLRDESWRVDTTLQHPDFVRDIVVHDRYGWVVTACRDEEVRVWNKASGQLHHVFSGHFEEVTGLVLVGDDVVSVGIDATVRKWSLEPKALAAAVEDSMKPEEQRGEEDNKENAEVGEGLLTAEEEAELAALMADEEFELQDKMAADEQ